MRPYLNVIVGLVVLLSATTAAAETEPDLTEPETELDVAKAATASVLKPTEEVARTYLGAVREQGFAAQADFVHPEEMVRFQGLLIPVFEAESQQGRRSLLNATFGRDASLVDARMAAPEEFMRRFSRVMAVRVPDQPVGFDELVVLGTVDEDDRVHVLVRLGMGVGEQAEDRLEVVSLMPHEGNWKVMLSPELEQAARAMQRRVGGERTVPRLVPRPPPIDEPQPSGDAEVSPALQ